MAPASTVSAFNRLTRPTTSPTSSSSVPNHWHFTVRPLASQQPPTDLLFLIQPFSAHIHVEGPTQILSQPGASGAPSSLAQQAAVIAPLLVKAFNSGLGAVDVPTFAPWSWATSEKGLADAVVKELKKMGVRKELRVVGTGNVEEDGRVEREWEKFRKGLSTMYCG